MKRKYRKYTKEFKLDAVRQHLEKGFSIAEIARRLEVNANLIGKWKAEYLADKAGAFSGESKITPEQKEITALRRENKQLRQERDILKKARVDSTCQCNTDISTTYKKGWSDGDGWTTRVDECRKERVVGSMEASGMSEKLKLAGSACR